MQIEHMLAQAADRVLTRLWRRAVCAAALLLFAIAALYQFTAAGMLQLTNDHGEIAARVIVAAIYCVAALGTFALLYVMRVRPVAKTEVTGVPAPLEVHIAMLIESAVLGYMLARK